MSDLRSDLMKLAHEQPELRKHLLPVLAGASKQAMNASTWQFDSWVSTWNMSVVTSIAKALNLPNVKEASGGGSTDAWIAWEPTPETPGTRKHLRVDLNLTGGRPEFRCAVLRDDDVNPEHMVALRADMALGYTATDLARLFAAKIRKSL